VRHLQGFRILDSLVRDKVGFTLYTQADEVGALVATTDGIFHPIWATKDDGALWTTQIEVDRSASTRPVLSIAGLNDVSKRLRLEARTFHYDEDSGRLLVDVVLINTSLGVPDREPRLQSQEENPKSESSDTAAIKEPLTPPLILRITSMQSEVGQLDLVNSDGIDSTGATLLDWSQALAPGGLAPGAQSSPRRLEFRLSGLKPGSDPEVIRVVSLTAEVFSK
jgi:hypothetical protein